MKEGRNSQGKHTKTEVEMKLYWIKLIVGREGCSSGERVCVCVTQDV